MSPPMMLTEKKVETGTLVVSNRSKSWFLSNNLPIEVRDAQHAFIESFKAREASRELPVGLYSVTAVFETGERETRTVQILSNRKSEVVFEHADDADDDDVTLESLDPRLKYNQLEAMSSDGDALGFDFTFDRDPLDANRLTSDIAVIGASSGLRLEGNARGVLKVELAGAGEHICWLLLARGNEHVRVALPLDTHSDESRRCTVRVCDSSDSRLRVRVETPSARRVTNALQGIVNSGKVGVAAELANEAFMLLAEKYRDPIGAAYGGLVLNRFGALEQRAPWVENLARDFSWLADGQILLAALLSRSRDAADLERGFDVLEAATRDPSTVFSEAFSLALTLLRRWPQLAKEPTAVDQRRQHAEKRLGELAEVASRFDYDETFSTVRWSR